MLVEGWAPSSSPPLEHPVATRNSTASSANNRRRCVIVAPFPNPWRGAYLCPGVNGAPSEVEERVALPQLGERLLELGDVRAPGPLEAVLGSECDQIEGVAQRGVGLLVRHREALAGLVE